MSDSSTLNALKSIGLFDEIQESIIYTDEPKIPTFICTPNDNSKKKFICNEVYGQGSSSDKTVAKIKTIGEFFERLCICNPNIVKLTNSKYITNDQIDPKSFICYSDKQFKDKQIYLNNLDNSKFDWYPAYDTINKKNKMIPAQLVYLYSNFDDGCLIRREQITTGTAFGIKNKNNMAFQSGFLESIERDSYITTYLTRRKISEIENFPAEIKTFLEYLKRYHLKSHVFDITTDLCVPTFMTVTIDETGIGSAVDIGTSSGYDYVNTIYDSIKESIQSRRISRFLKESGKRSITNNKIKTMQDRYYYWYNSDKIKYLDFWLKNSKKISFDSLPIYSKSIKETESIFKDRNYHVYVVDISIDDITRKGFETLKVIIPELHPLYLDESAKSLYSIHAGTIVDDKSLNPHPFA